MYRILVLDDEVSVCHLLSKILSLHGYEVTATQSGSEALRMSLQNSWDVLITDGHMAEIDGATFASLVRKRMPWMPIIMISGFPDEYRKNSDFVAVLPKPFKVEALLATLQRTISDRDLRT